MSELNLIHQDSQATRADAVKNRAQILETAARLFANATQTGDSIEFVSVSDIAEAAGVGKGTLYRHFPNGKTDVCMALLDEDQRDLQERTLTHLRQNGNPFGSLNWFLVEVVNFVERNRPLLCAGVADTTPLVTPPHWWWRQTIYGLLSQMGANGDLDYLADTLYILIDVRTIHYLRTARGYDIDRVQNNLLEAVTRLIG